jgi:hypothetical protein
MSTVLESGDVFFFYRPRVGVEEVKGLDDVQRFFFVLSPAGKKHYRRLILGRKRLPDPREHERAWAFVAEVADRPEDMRDDLERTAYETRTRGIRVQPEARPAGEGRYAIVDHDGHTHFAYVLELPHQPGEAQRAFGILAEASYVVAVRNPEADAPPGTGLPPRQRPTYPRALAELFGSRRFIPVNPPGLLDHAGAEIVLISAAAHVSQELGVDLSPEDEDIEDADIFRRLHVSPRELPIEPLVRGELR